MSLLELGSMVKCMATRVMFTSTLKNLAAPMLNMTTRANGRMDYQMDKAQKHLIMSNMTAQADITLANFVVENQMAMEWQNSFFGVSSY